MMAAVFRTRMAQIMRDKVETETKTREVGTTMSHRTMTKVVLRVEITLIKAAVVHIPTMAQTWMTKFKVTWAMLVVAEVSRTMMSQLKEVIIQIKAKIRAMSTTMTQMTMITVVQRVEMK